MSTFSPPGAERGGARVTGAASGAVTAPGGGPEKGAAASRHLGRGLVALDGALALIGVLLVVQMWLVTAALESFLAGHREVAVPAAVISGLIFAGCAALYYFVDGLDVETRSER